jgi:O-methyltransferase
MGLVSTVLGVFGYELPESGWTAVSTSRFIPGSNRTTSSAPTTTSLPRTLVSADRCHVLYQLLLQLAVEGDVWECGVTGRYCGNDKISTTRSRGGSFISSTPSRACETDDAEDLHAKGDFSDTSAEAMAQYLGHPLCVIRKGFIPDTFAGLESSRIALAHIDVDIHRSVQDSLEFIWPRLSPGGFVVCDDYGFPSCPGARSAVDKFFAGKTAVPLCLPTGQALVFKSGA